MSKGKKQIEKPFENFDSFEELFEQAEKRPSFWTERAKLEFTREVVSLMHAQNVSKGELASRLEVSPSMVTRLLSGENNFKLSTMVRIAMALECRYRSHLQPKGSKTVWLDVSNSPTTQYCCEEKEPSFNNRASIAHFFPTMCHVNSPDDHEASALAA